MANGLITVLSGFSGAGKGTIMKHLLGKYPGVYHLSISATTRAMREGETDGKDYFFKTRDEFDAMIKNGEFLEYATFNGNSYGTPKSYVEGLVAEGKDVLLEIEVQGALQVKKLYPDALLLFVTPPSAKMLKDRLVGRKTETSEVIAQRMAISSKESYLMPEYDYLIVNDEIDKSVETVHGIIASEKLKCARNIKEIERMQQELKTFAKGDF